MPLTVINGPVIDAGEALSDVVDVSAGLLVRMTMPAGWSEALLSFQISSDGEFFNDLYNYEGREMTLVVKPGAGIIFPRDFFTGVEFLRFRSGTSEQEVPQPERREFSVAISKGSSPLDQPVVEPTRARRKTPRKTAKPRRKHR